VNDEVRDMIAKALAGEPPLRLDYAAVRRDGRRRLARRHLSIAGAAALSVVAVVCAAVAVGQLAASAPDGSLPPASGSASPAPTSPSTPVAPLPGCETAGRVLEIPPTGKAPVPRVQAVPASQAALAESARLTEAFGRVALPLPAGVSVVPAKPPLCAVGGSWRAEFVLHGPGGDRAVNLEVRPRGGQPPGECARFGGRVQCDTRTLPDGTVVRISKSPPPEPSQPEIVDASAWRPDQTVVKLFESGSEAPKAVPRILDNDALVAIATRPELGLRWSEPVAPVPAEPSDRVAAALSAAFAAGYQLPAGIRAMKASGSAAAMTFYVSQGGYKLNTDLADAGGMGNLFIDLSPPVQGGTRPNWCEGQSDCAVVTLPDGRTAARSTHTDAGAITISVSTLAADGTGVSVMCTNQSGNSGRITRKEPPLGLPELLKIVSGPELHW
jgi:hypothetical protein